MPSHERLVADWHIEDKRAIQGITWVIGLFEEAVRTGRWPTQWLPSSPPIVLTTLTAAVSSCWRQRTRRRRTRAE